MTAQGCGAPEQTLLDRTGEFTGEVVVSDDGVFRFFAAPGDWTVRIIAGGGVTRDVQVEAKLGEVAQLAVAV
jgi:hypothetical protein